MFRRGDKWWTREIERINRAHADETAKLIATICRLSGHPEPVPPAPDPEAEQRRREARERRASLIAHPERLPD